MTGPGPRYTREEVLDALERGGSVKGAAAFLQVSRQTLYDYLRRYSIEVKRALKAA
jgi:transposase